MYEVKTYGRTELAQLYFPAICPRAAWAKLRLYMSDYPQLHPLLSNTRRSFLPSRSPSSSTPSAAPENYTEGTVLVSLL